MIGVRIVGIQPERALERPFRLAVLAQVAVHQAEHIVGGRVTRVRGYRGARFGESHAEVSPLVVRPRQLGMDARALPGAGDLADDRPAVGFAGQIARERPSGAAEKRRRQGEHVQGAQGATQEVLPSRRAGL